MEELILVFLIAGMYILGIGEGCCKKDGVERWGGRFNMSQTGLTIPAFDFLQVRECLSPVRLFRVGKSGNNYISK